MHKKLILLLGVIITFTISAQTQKTKVFTLNLYFDTDKYNLKSSEQEKIDALFDTLDLKRIKSISMTGHTDSRADSAYNIKLSQNRTATVGKYLLLMGLPKQKITAGFFGENKPTAENQSDLGKQKNRRVELKLIYTYPPPAVVVKDSVVKKELIDTCKGDTLITLKNGMLLKFDKCNFTKYKNCISVTTISNVQELKASGLNMYDDKGNPLISKGMFKLDWDPKCGSCTDFTAKWLMTEEDYKKGKYNFYDYNTSSGDWTQLPRKTIKKVRIKNKNYYEVELTCADMGRWKNADCVMIDFDSPLAKIKVNRNWKFVSIESDSAVDLFYYYKYKETEITKRKHVYKTLPLESDVYVLINKRKKDTIWVSALDLKPRKTKLLKHQLTKTHWDSTSKFEGWPHIAIAEGPTSPIAKHYNKTSKKYYRKYKISKKVIQLNRAIVRS